MPFIAAVSLAGLALAQEAAPTPHYRPGDSWSFEVVAADGRKFTRTERITAVDADAIDLVFAIEGVPGERRVRFTPEGNRRDKRGSDIGQVKHPISVGKEWESKFTATLNGAHGDGRMQRKVVALSRVKVPAGEFDCYEIEAHGFYTNFSDTSQNGGGGAAEESYCYAPKVKRIIRYDSRLTSTSHGTTATIWSVHYELKSFHLAE